MIASYRAWSAVMGFWYLVAVSSLTAHPPGEESQVRTGTGHVAVPEHLTFFQAALSWQFWAVAFGAGAVLLLTCAWLAWRLLRGVHLIMLLVCYVFGIGYVANSLQLDQAWLAGSLALVVASAHVALARVASAVELAEVLGGKS